MSKQIDRALELVRKIHEGECNSPIKTEPQLCQVLARSMTPGEAVHELTSAEVAKFFVAPDAPPPHAPTFQPEDAKNYDARWHGARNYAAYALRRFKAAALAADVAGLFGWGIDGLGAINIVGLDADDVTTDYGFAVELSHHHSYGVLRIELGDETVILWSPDPATKPWFRVRSWLALSDLLGDEAEEADSLHVCMGSHPNEVGDKSIALSVKEAR